MPLKVYVDGFRCPYCRGFCYFYEGQTPKVFFIVNPDSIPILETKAVLAALSDKELPNRLKICTDSRNLVQLISDSECNQYRKVRPLIERILILLNEKKSEIFWVPREKNLAGLYLEELNRIRRNFRGLPSVPLQYATP